MQWLVLGVVLPLLGWVVADHVPLAFLQFQRDFGKAYADPGEYAQRLALFRRNLDRIRAHNAEYDLGRRRFFLAINEFADQDDHEFAARGGYRRSPRPVNPAEFVEVADNGPLPNTVDWRQLGMVTRVKNQRQCGSCWSFSATGAMEGAHAHATGELVEFSEQQLVDCVDNGADDCNTGGEMRRAFAYVIKAGAETERQYPYRATSGHRCKAGEFETAARFTSYVNITQGDERSLQTALAKHPAVSVAIDAGSFEFQMYGGGIYENDFCGNGPEDLDHGVLAVGYGSDPVHGDYWIVKNSWGPTWGESGYVRMARNRHNQCGIATDASYIVVHGQRRLPDNAPVSYL